jgi:hypothetical protein
MYFELARTELTPGKIEAAIDRIAEQGLIVRYGPYAFLPNWYKHQNLKGRKPQETKLRRPPREVLEQYPHYLEEWCSTFVHKIDGQWEPREYPFKTCFTPATTSESPVATAEADSFTPATTSDSPVTHQCATGDSPVTPNRSEVKGSEVNSYIAASGPGEAVASLSEDPNLELHGRAMGFFRQLQPDRRFVNDGREGKAVKTLVAEARARSPDDPSTWLRSVCEVFVRLKRGPDPFWRKQPLLPSTLASGGILPRVLDAAREHDSLDELSWQEGESA